MADFWIDLTGGRRTVIDRIDGFSLHLAGPGYVRCDRGAFTVYLHRLIAGAGTDEIVDHRDGDPLNNRLGNLRRCTRAENRANAGPNRGGTSHYKGVSWDRRRDAWKAYIHVNGRTRWLGRFDQEQDAARAYDSAALAEWGEFARLNLPGGSSDDAGVPAP